MKKVFLMGLAIGVCTIGVFETSYAVSIEMQGEYVRTAVSDDGTLGWGGTTSPGIIHDPSGSGDFSGHDYLTPGSPWEIFSVQSDETGLRVNNNAVGTTEISPDSLSDLSASSAYDNYLSWKGSYTDYFDITTDYFFNDGDERISISTTITAITNLTNLSFLRAIDPDPDNYPGGTPYTYNGRGFDSNGDGDYDDLGDLALEDWVHSEGGISGLTLGLYSNSAITHNTAVTRWSADPLDYNGSVSGTYADDTIGLSFDIGRLSSGESITLDYAYVMGDSIETVDIPTDPVPEPATMLLFGTGLMGLVGNKMRKKKK